MIWLGIAYALFCLVAFIALWQAIGRQARRWREESDRKY